MANLFSGLENLGLGKLSDMNIYEEENTEVKDGKKVEKQITEVDLIFDKTYKCPVCDKEVKSKAVKTGKVKLLSADTDLRPRYQLVDSLKYDAVVCNHCGYAALTRYFDALGSAQAKLIKEHISANYKGQETTDEIYTYDEAIARHKLSLVNAIVKKAKNSEKAYICLKLSWLIRGKAEELPKDTTNYEEVVRGLVKEEKEFTLNAYDGFISAFSKESFPMCGMDEYTTTYLVGDLARRCGKLEEASRWISRVLVDREANERIKAKARDIKELLLKAK